MILCVLYDPAKCIGSLAATATRLIYIASKHAPPRGPPSARGAPTHYFFKVDLKVNLKVLRSP